MKGAQWERYRTLLQTNITVVGKDGRNNKQNNSKSLSDSRRKSFQKCLYAKITKKKSRKRNFNEEDCSKLNQIFYHEASLRAEIQNL